MSAETDFFDKLDPKEKLRLLRIIVQGVYETLIAQGQLNPVGKTPAAVVTEFLDLSKQRGSLKLVAWHGGALLTEARRFAGLGKQEIALLFYATWFEHWINGLMDRKAHQLKLSTEALKLLLRQTGFEAKLVCFPALAKLPRIREQHRKAVLRCAQLRNSFVHYKFSVGTRDDEEDRYKGAISAAEKAVKYLMRFEQRHIFKGAKHRLRKLLFSRSMTKK
jgi:hypothetical protein